MRFREKLYRRWAVNETAKKRKKEEILKKKKENLELIESVSEHRSFVPVVENL